MSGRADWSQNADVVREVEDDAARAAAPPVEPCPYCSRTEAHDHGTAYLHGPDPAPSPDPVAGLREAAQAVMDVACNFDPYYCRAHNSERHSVIDNECAARLTDSKAGAG